MYRFSLDKSSKKFICPSCHKKTFVRYVDNETTHYLESEYGRCDRESSCKYHQSPTTLGTISTPLEPKPKREKSTIDSIEVSKHGRNFKRNNFIQFLRSHFSDDEVKSAILKYLIGTSDHWNGSTVFWQINQYQEILTGKIMLFDLITAKRVKTPYNHINWAHKTLKIPNFELQQCLFGLHLINEYPKKTIALVESEKTAITMSLFLPDYLWIATGSKSNFKKELVEPVKGFNIIAYPDKSEYEDWNRKTTQLRQDGYTIKCSNYIERKEVPKGTDLADVYFESKTSKRVEIKYTKTETEVNRLAKINPEIINLIRTFDLLDGDDNGIVNIDCYK
ncbi:MAG: hypothetical protein ACI87N_001626 [Flavobacteriales bacterium]|jgi:hypothetical protein